MTCDWPVDYGACGKCPELADVSSEQRELFENMAIDLLWRFTDKQFGLCEVTVRPCAAERYSRASTFQGRGPRVELEAVRIDDVLRAFSCGCTRSCACSLESAASLRLPGPVDSIVKVVIDGETLDASAYRLMYGNVLVRADRSGWPLQQDLLAADDEVGAFAITYKYGDAVPAGGQAAAGKLACQLAKAYCGSKDCQLPERVQTISRQGVTVGIADAFEGLERGRTGIWSIDAWIESVTRRKSFAGVRSPDLPRQPLGVMLR